MTRNVALKKGNTPEPWVRGIPVSCDITWRYRWDLNPRWAFTHTTFRELHLRPLGHGTAHDFTRLA